MGGLFPVALFKNLADRFYKGVGAGEDQTLAAPVESAPRVDESVDAGVLWVTENTPMAET